LETPLGGHPAPNETAVPPALDRHLDADRDHSRRREGASLGDYSSEAARRVAVGLIAGGTLLLHPGRYDIGRGGLEHCLVLPALGEAGKKRDAAA
jgi:hypothetical protein